jgi:hypothetical protein
MICPDCDRKFELVEVGSIQCPNCKAQLQVHIGEFTTNVAEYKKYLYQSNICFALAIISISFSYSYMDEGLTLGICLILIIFPNLLSAFGAGFISFKFGPLLKSAKPTIFKLVTLILVLLFVYLLFSVIDALI